jgi:hypothetical protein
MTRRRFGFSPLILRLTKLRFLITILYAINTGQWITASYRIKRRVVSICEIPLEKVLRGVYRAKKQKPPSSLGRVCFRLESFR